MILPKALLVVASLAGGGQATDFIYTCGGMASPLIARFQKRSVQLRGEQQWVVVPQGRSGSGARYTNGTVLFWIKGQNAQYDAGDGVIRTCRVTGRG